MGFRLYHAATDSTRRIGHRPGLAMPEAVRFGSRDSRRLAVTFLSRLDTWRRLLSCEKTVVASRSCRAGDLVTSLDELRRELVHPALVIRWYGWMESSLW